MTLKNKMLMKRLLVHLQQVLRLLLPLLSMLLMLLVRPHGILGSAFKGSR